MKTSPHFLLRLALVALAVSFLSAARAAVTNDLAEIPPPPEDTPIQGQANAAAHQRLAWWRKARFGMFIHWGLYSQDGCFYKGTNGISEHMMRHLQIPLADYAKIANDFNPTNFNAAEIVRIAKTAGIKYLVITAKHHDGFAMFDSPSSDYNIVKRTPWQRDPIRELAAACHAAGLKFGVYYSLGRDWEDPDAYTKDGRRSNTWDFPEEDKKVFGRYLDRKVKPQITELLTRFGSIDVLWFDTPESISAAQSRELLVLIRKLQPDCVVNARLGNGLGDYNVREQEIPGKGDRKPWETCMTINAHWGYFKGDEKWKTSAAIIRNLIDVASKGGNYLLNIGPTRDGSVPPQAVEILAHVGTWMRVNGAAIYGTTASPLQTQPVWGRVTKKGSTLYLSVFEWPKDGKLVLAGLPAEVLEARLLTGSGQKLKVESADGQLAIDLPPTAPDAIATVIVLKLASTLQDHG